VDFRLFRKRYLLEFFATQPEQAVLIAYEDRAIGAFANGSGHAGGQAVFGCKLAEANALIAEDTVFRHYPDETGAILEKGFDGQIGETLFHTEVLEGVLLRVCEGAGERKKKKTQRAIPEWRGVFHVKTGNFVLA